MNRDTLQVLVLIAGTIFGLSTALDVHLGRVSDVTLVTGVAVLMLAFERGTRRT